MSAPGRFIAVVGPSGVGKDSLIDAICAARPQMRRVRRAITRPAEAGGEAHLPRTPEGFAQDSEAGAFCLQWHAHGLSYGIPADVRGDLARGVDCIANLSRGQLTHAAQAFPRLTVLHVTASPEVLAARLAGRGRESAAQIASRLAQAEKPLPEGLITHLIRNDGPLQEALSSALAALSPVQA